MTFPYEKNMPHRVKRNSKKFNANCRSFSKMETKTIMFQERFKERLQNNALLWSFKLCGYDKLLLKFNCFFAEKKKLRDLQRDTRMHGNKTAIAFDLF